MIIHDITVPISPELPVYPGDPTVEVTPLMTLAAGDIAAVSRLCCGTHTGTHIDPPAHFIPGGLTVDQLPLDILVGPCRVLDAGALQVITAEWLAGQPLDGVSRLLFRTSMVSAPFSPTMSMSILRPPDSSSNAASAWSESTTSPSRSSTSITPRPI